ncbi:MAG: sigma-70 family RNA polymerase sigma factor [Clostridia bacterium]|nr:sigma-70 family RNA polymerase sigma factor [Clostridia bacterium]
MYQEDLLRVCFLYLQDQGLAEDAVQETFLKAYRALPQYREECSPKTWLTRIAINTCKDYRRTFWFRRVRWNEMPEWAVSHGPDVSEESIAVSVEIARLPPKLKETVLLYYYQDMTVNEIAEALGISQSSVSARLIRAREKLRAALKGVYFHE